MNKQVTKNPGKQRLKLYKAPMHVKRKSLVCPLNKALQKQYGVKNIAVRKGDIIKVIVGDDKGKIGKIEKVDYSSSKVFVKDVKYKNVRGQEKLTPLVTSNLLLTELIMTDSKRIIKKKTPKKVK
jgi:ribosomal protein uL24